MTGLERLRAAALPHGTVGLWWLGQAGVALRGEGLAGARTVLIDPFLSPHPERRFPPALAPERAEGVDAVLVTHEHWDHLDPDALAGIATASPGAWFVAPAPVTAQVAERVPAGRVLGIRPGDEIDVGGVRVRTVHACHGVTMADAYGFGDELPPGGERFVGYVVTLGGLRVYHAGDTVHFAGMEGELRDAGVDVALVPVNGRDPSREARDVVGNLSAVEAAALAVAAGARVLVPLHHDMFAGNPGRPEDALAALLEASADIAFVAPGHRDPVTIGLPERDRSAEGGEP